MGCVRGSPATVNPGSRGLSNVRVLNTDDALTASLCEARLLVLVRTCRFAGLAHRLDDGVERHEVLAVAGSARRAAVTAVDAAIALRSIQGICTSPPIGIAGEPEVVLHRDLGRVLDLPGGATSHGGEGSAANAYAEPTSAWHPPPAPEIEGFAPEQRAEARSASAGRDGCPGVKTDGDDRPPPHRGREGAPRPPPRPGAGPAAPNRRACRTGSPRSRRPEPRVGEESATSTSRRRALCPSWGRCPCPRRGRQPAFCAAAHPQPAGEHVRRSGAPARCTRAPGRPDGAEALDGTARPRSRRATSSSQTTSAMVRPSSRARADRPRSGRGERRRRSADASSPTRVTNPPPMERYDSRAITAPSASAART